LKNIKKITFFLISRHLRFGEHKLAKDRWWAGGQAQPGVNFINVLQADLMRADPENVKMTVKLSIFFCDFRIFACKSWS